MDIDRFVAANRRDWDRLAVLVERGRRVRTLSATELDELVVLYQRVGTHLSYARSTFREPSLTSRLSRLVASASNVVYGTRARTLRGALRFLTHTFPAALAHSRGALVASTLLLFVPAIAAVLSLANDPARLSVLGSAAERAAYQDAATDYYSEQPSAQFASMVFTNNVRVAVTAFGLGIAVCVGTAYVLAANGLNLGGAVAVFVDAGRGWEFLGLLVPHGLIELSAVVVAGAAGLRLGWAIIDPGDRPRGRALADEGRRSVALVMGTAAMLLVAGIIEGFVTGSPLPTAVRVGIGVAVEAAFVLYAVVYGRRARAAGLTGAIGEVDVGWATRRTRRVSAAS